MKNGIFTFSDHTELLKIKTIQLDTANAQRNQQLKSILKSLSEEDDDDEQSNEQKELLDLIS